VKRIFDLISGFVLLIVTLPFILVIALLIYFKMGRPVYFRQQRPGFRGKPFFLYKFRTMTTETDAKGKLLADEERLTGLGRRLRRNSLDELPQLINVIKGELSFVGPRPLLMEYLPRYSAEQARRHEVKPGITGWAQVNGRNAISWEEKFEHDLWYVDNQSFWLDLKILGMTLAKVLKSEGISQDGSATMTEFLGDEESPEEKED
jgi:sugar transferase EpsL